MPRSSTAVLIFQAKLFFPMLFVDVADQREWGLARPSGIADDIHFTGKLDQA
jgi:hypothetical protein